MQRIKKKPWLVSIPYGKGKDDNNAPHQLSTNVSIPYGKGKDVQATHTAKTLVVYQFPMGKVKNNI